MECHRQLAVFYWNLFLRTGEPLAYLVYRLLQA